MNPKLKKNNGIITRADTVASVSALNIILIDGYILYSAM